MPYRISSHAKDDVIAIYVEGTREFGLEQADIYYSMLDDVFSLIGDYPEMARLREEITPPVRIHPFKSHMIVYEVEGDWVTILRVRHARENWIASPKS